jgi:protein pelota
MRIRVDTIEDLWSVQRVLFPNDIVKSESERKFRSDESDKGELKKVFITLRVEKTELDKAAQRLRILGKIVEGKPLEYVRLNSYHTINVAPGDVLEIVKQSWPGYVLQVIRGAVLDSKRPRLGLVLVDEEKAMPAYLLGYGVEFRNEVYSGLSKRMSQKDFQEQQNKYYEKILEIINRMDVDTVVMAGPGFAKDDIKKYGEERGIIEKMHKRIVYAPASNTERSGVYELIRSASVAKLLEKERIRNEFLLMERFLSGLSSGLSRYGVKEVADYIENGSADTVIVNDSAIGTAEVQSALAEAERRGLKITVFNSEDEVGAQLQAFKQIAAMAGGASAS